MYMALNAQGEPILAYQAAQDRTGRWYCPRCHQVLYLKTSKKGQAFFAHYHLCGQSTPSTRSSQLRQESMEHRQFKEQLQAYFQTGGLVAESEYYLEGIHQFADLLLQYHRLTWILEFQQVPIPRDLLYARHQAYLTQTPWVHWLTTEKGFAKKGLSAWYKTCLQYSPSLGFYLLTWHPDKQQIRLRPHLPIFYRADEPSFPVYNLPPGFLLDLNRFGQKTSGEFRTVVLNDRIVRHDPYSLDVQRLLASVRIQSAYRSILGQLYRWGLSLTDIPSWLLTSQWQSPLMHQAAWLALVLFYGYLMQVQRSAGRESLLLRNIVKQGFYHVFQAYFGRSHAFPLVDCAVYPFLFDAMVTLFEAGGILKEEAGGLTLRMVS